MVRIHFPPPASLLRTWVFGRASSRAGFDRIPAVQHQDLYEIKSSLIVQPGPAALTDGLAELEKIIRHWAGLLA